MSVLLDRTARAGVNQVLKRKLFGFRTALSARATRLLAERPTLGHSRSLSVTHDAPPCIQLSVTLGHS
eukprot:2794475-Pyramimonas_sp.AAC.1